MPDSEKQVLESESAEGQQPLSEAESVAESGAGQEPVPETESAAQSGDDLPSIPEAENAAAHAESAPAKQGEPGGENPEERKPVPEYDIVPSKRLEPESNFAADHYRPIAEALAGQSQQGHGKKAGSIPALSEISIERIGKLASSQTNIYAVIGVGLGLLVGLLIAVTFLHPGTQSSPTDMGTVNSNQYGLKGQLTTNWTTKLDYRVTIEPIGPGQRAAFICRRELVAASAFRYAADEGSVWRGAVQPYDPVEVRSPECAQ